MHFQSVVVSLLLATSVTAHGHGHGNNTTKAISEKAECKKMLELNKLVELAANTTKLEAMTKNNATKIADIKAKAAAASTKLATLQSNSTLVLACAVIDAHEAEENQCQEAFALQRLVKFAANSTAVATATQNNATKIAKIQSEASKASVKLQALTSNTTLQADCPAVMQEDECHMMKKLQKFVDVANNQTKLDKLTKGNATKEAEIKARAGKDQVKLTAMTSNSTFMAACAALEGKGAVNNTGNAGTASTASTKGNTNQNTTTKGAASMLSGAGTGFLGLSTALVVLVGMFAL